MIFPLILRSIMSLFKEQSGVLSRITRDWLWFPIGINAIQILFDSELIRWEQDYLLRVSYHPSKKRPSTSIKDETINRLVLTNWPFLIELPASTLSCILDCLNKNRIVQQKNWSTFWYFLKSIFFRFRYFPDACPFGEALGSGPKLVFKSNLT